MNHSTRFLVVAVGLGLLGCTTNLAQTGTPIGATVGATGQSVSQVPAGTLPSQKGTLKLTIKWPERDYPGFKAQAIPLTTNAIQVRVKQGDTVLGQQLITREPGISTVAADFSLDAATNLTVEVKAYREANPDLATATPIAQGTATGVNLVRSQESSVTVSLASLFVPTITGLSANAGGMGDTVTITGTNFGSGTIPVKVAFNGQEVPAQDVSRISDTSLIAKVPDGATTGRIVVTADGVPSSVSSTSTFWVAKSLTIDAPKASWDYKPANERIVLFGKSLQFTATVSWVFQVGESGVLWGVSPSVNWNCSDGSYSAAGSIGNSGEFIAYNTYATSSVFASVGSINSKPIVVTSDKALLRVGSHGGLLGGKGEGFVDLWAFHEFSDGATNSFVSFQSMDPASFSVDASGRCNSIDFSSNGSSSVKISSLVDLGISAKLDLDIRNYVVETLAGDGSRGYRDGDASSSQFVFPAGVAEYGGDIYIADTFNGRIRKLDQNGRVSTIYYGRIALPESIDFDVSGNAFIADSEGNTIYRMSSSGDVSVFAGPGFVGAASTFNQPTDVSVGDDGAIYVADTGNHMIRKVDISGKVTTIAGNGSTAILFNPSAVSFWKSGKVLVADTTNKRIKLIGPDLGIQSIAGDGRETILNVPAGVCIDGNGSIFIADTGNSRIRKLSSSGVLMTIAGDGSLAFRDGVGTNAQFYRPKRIRFDSSGRLLIADTQNNRIRRMY